VTALKEKLELDEITPNKLALVGRSAGAHLALRYGYGAHQEGSPPISTTSPIPVKLIVADVGPTDATDAADFFGAGMDWNVSPEKAYPLLSSLLGTEVPVIDWNAIPANILGLLEKASPVSYVSQNTPPTLLRYAEHDNMVPASQGDKLKAALEASNKWEDVDFNLFHFPNSGHNLDSISTPVEDSALYQYYWTTYDWYFNEYMIGEPED